MTTQDEQMLDTAQTVRPEDLGDYAFVHDVRVSSDGSRAYFEVTRVDMEDNRYRTDIWTADAASGDAHRLTTSGEEGHYDLADDGSLVFVSRRLSKAADGAGAGASKGDTQKGPRGTDLFRISPTGGEAELLVRVAGRAVSDWAQIDDDRFVLRCRANIDTSSPVVEIEEIPFYENGGTYTAGTRWGLWLLDLSALPADKMVGRPCGEDGTGDADASGEAGNDGAPEGDGSVAAFRLLTLDNEEVGNWALSEDRTRVLFASKRFDDVRPAADEVWFVDVATGERTLVDGAPKRVSGMEAYRGGVLYLGSDMLTYGVNEDPQPWWCPLGEGAAAGEPLLPGEPRRLDVSEGDLYYGAAVGGDSSYGGGQDSLVLGDDWYFLTTEFDHTYLRRMTPDGAMERIEGIQGEPTSFDTADGRTFWYVAESPRGLPEVWSLTLPGAGDAPTDGPRRITYFSDALAGKCFNAPEEFEFESNGDTITGYVIKPVGYEPGKKYPGVLEVHGGPKGTYGTVYSQEMQSIAALGCFVFFTNPHGSAGRGVAFSDIRGRYGGFMTNWVIGHTDRFRCANSQRSIASYMTKSLVSDIGYWINMPETTALLGDQDVPQAMAFEGDNPRKLWEQSPIAFAGNVKTPTLFLHSDEDYRCPLEEGMQMFTALQLRHVPSRLVIFKGESHGLCRIGKPKNRVRRLEEILAWYRRWLFDGDSAVAGAGASE